MGFWGYWLLDLNLHHFIDRQDGIKLMMMVENIKAEKIVEVLMAVGAWLKGALMRFQGSRRPSSREFPWRFVKDLSVDLIII